VTARPRGFIVVTGSELVRGERSDLNGPFLATELFRHGVEPARISIVGDREEELAEALADGRAAADLSLVVEPRPRRSARLRARVPEAAIGPARAIVRARSHAIPAISP